ncbi:MAG TPA: glycine zipper 2TM domain-containing protein [Rhizomicrobium sp.]
MLRKTVMLLAVSALALTAGAASAQQGGGGYNDPNGPPPGYNNGPPPPPDNGGPPPPDNYGPPPGPPPGNNYGPPPGPPPPGPPPDQRNYYGDDCRAQNTGAGTVLGAIAGGVIGSQFGHGGGRAAATVGGVVLGGVIGNKIAGDMDCQDRQYAFRTYNQGLEGNIGQRYQWRDPRGHYGYFTPTREFRQHHRWCRDFEEGVWRHGRWVVNTGTACRFDDGWHFM